MCSTLCMDRGIGETGVSRDTFHFFSNIAENMYDRDLELTRQGRIIFLYKQVYLCYVITYSLRQNTASTTRGRTLPTYPVTG